MSRATTYPGHITAVVAGCNESRVVRYNPESLNGYWEAWDYRIDRKRYVAGTIFLYEESAVFLPSVIADREWIAKVYAVRPGAYRRRSYRGIKPTEIERYSELREDAA